MQSSAEHLKIVFHIYHINLSLWPLESSYWGEVKSSYFQKRVPLVIILPRHCITLCVCACVWGQGLVRNAEAIYCTPAHFAEILRMCEEEISAFCVHNTILKQQRTNGESAISRHTLILGLCILSGIHTSGRLMPPVDPYWVLVAAGFCCFWLKLSSTLCECCYFPASLEVLLSLVIAWSSVSWIWGMLQHFFCQIIALSDKLVLFLCGHVCLTNILAAKACWPLNEVWSGALLANCNAEGGENDYASPTIWGSGAGMVFPATVFGGHFFQIPRCSPYSHLFHSGAWIETVSEPALSHFKCFRECCCVTAANTARHFCRSKVTFKPWQNRENSQEESG